MRMYRGKPVDNPKGDWVKGWYVPLNGKHYILPDKPRYDDTLIDNLVEVIGKTVSQSTGEYDCNNKEIYKQDYYKIDGVVCLVDWLQGGYVLIGEGFNGEPLGVQNMLGEGEIIGNVTDTPELIEESS